MELSEYTSSLESAISHARRVYFPNNKADRKSQNIKLGREIGYGLASFCDYSDYLQSSYSRVVVKNSFDSTGVCIDSKEWVAAINAGVKQHEDYQSIKDTNDNRND